MRVCVALADAPEAGRPQAVHFGEAGGELLDTAESEAGVEFDTRSFSVFGVL